ncbi:flagellar biosynthesis protein FlhF [Thermosediminibacter oceani]|uniref:Flagellar biosynthesis protein FlhF n=1 Tax=Thermosediminibacter oceani (strain ATCC BAA-1034 / DSM 16646 / JW/IW-1228P) TaxID=555079 RepID=D9S3A2_THEOJ|nr:flagellar biosynthesis protein FlhF [Thermosediminibacter oceani]ADL07879.1 flagellar biosynthetic protein FlhF [Thermosediminibacter oceani DSM 16646]
MRIKTYIADNIQEALYKVKSELGKDAIILQTRQIKKGGILGFLSKTKVEVIAACDVNATAKPMSNPVIYSVPKRENSQEKLEDIKNEINEVKDMLKNLYSRGVHIEKPLPDLPSPLGEIYQRLKLMEIDKDLIDKFIDGLKRDFPGENFDENAAKTYLKNQIISIIKPTEPIKFLESEPSKIVFVGPTGVGKTTTIAKLAAFYTLNQGKKVALVTADTYRVGAVEQLKTYGDLLEIPVEVIFEPKEAPILLKKLSGYDLILIDTMGTSPRNKMQIKKIKGLIENIKPTETHMVISATTRTGDIYEILENYKEINYQKLIFTKLDETRTYGLILNAIYSTNCSPSYLTVGQNVPDDIEVASAAKIADLILEGSDR